MAKKDRLFDLLAPQVADLGYECYDVEYVKQGGRPVLTIYIDKDGGVSLEDCEAVSRSIGAFMDAADPIRDAYTLQVSSPGLERKLTRTEHYKKVIGEMIDVKCYRAQDGKKTFCARLKDADDDHIVIEDEEKGDVTLSYDDIAKASLHFEF